jgi:hypothetical protein
MTSMSQDKSLAAGLVMHCPHTDTKTPFDNVATGNGGQLGSGMSSGNLSGSRRKLPRTPEISSVPSNSADGNEVLIQSWLDVDRRELVVSIVCARLHRSHSTPCYGQVRILPTPYVPFIHN